MSTHAACGNCGADIPVPPSGGLVTCEFCRSSLYVEGGGTVRHFLYRPTVRPEEVAGHVNRWLFVHQEGESAEVTTTRLVYYPFWRIERGARIDLVPAAASPEGPLDEISSPAGELVAVDPSTQQEEEMVPAAAPPPARTGEHSKTAWLVHVPVYHATYRLAGREDVVLVEATSGGVIAYTAAAGTVGRTSRLDAAIIMGGAATLVLTGAFIPWGWAALACWAVVGAGLFVLLSRRLRGGAT